ncbi:lipid-A-disaccharide synthase [Candidatus Termititenax persephonae]|uniref:Lipid-A-disaccharide synthase n=1 Tax=Candidatus Termititenax persephonae TaxID=2218525 RepID=A0A388TGS6_9BACT|nr:lipid-A-disaccharide synthase [Candidatus Termititenax persephonae]
MREIIFTVNGPGELSGLIFPLVKAFRRQYPDFRYTLYVVPCQFRAGNEAELARESGLFQNVFSVAEYRKYIFRKTWPSSYQPAPQTIVFYGGGDSWHARALAKKYACDLYGYDEGKVARQGWFKKLFSRDRDGNLMVDAALARDIGYQAVPIGSEKLTVGLYPGSRPRHLRVLVPFLSAAAEILSAKYPNINFRWGIRPELRRAVEHDFPQRFSAPYEQPGEKYDLLIALTGTNTAISAALGIPLLILLPLNYPELVPFDGLLGLLSDLPWAGRLLKRLLIAAGMRGRPYIAIPNIKAGRRIAPELVGVLTPPQVAAAAEETLLNIEARRVMHEDLPLAIGKPGAQNIVNYFAELWR